jgi:hypothetical protein
MFKALYRSEAPLGQARGCSPEGGSGRTVLASVEAGRVAKHHLARRCSLPAARACGMRAALGTAFRCNSQAACALRRSVPVCLSGSKTTQNITKAPTAESVRGEGRKDTTLSRLAMMLAPSFVSEMKTALT